MIVPGSINPGMLGGGGYQIANSLRFDGSDDYLSRTFGTPTDNKKWVWRCLVKRDTLGVVQTLFQQFDYSGGGTTNDQCGVRFTPADTLELWNYSGGYLGQKITTQVFRDPTAHMDIQCVWDSANATAADRMQVYVNGARVTSFGTSSDPALNQPCIANRAGFLHTIGVFYDADYGAPTNYFEGYLSDIYFIDGQALTPSSFGETDANGVWVPKAYTGSRGNNGFHLDFTDGTSTTTLGYDEGAGTNNWTLNGMTRAAGVSECWMTDTPTNNYCTLNQINKYTEFGSLAVVSAGLATSSGGTDFAQVLGTTGIKSGKWYFEGTLTTTYALGTSQIGIAPTSFKMSGYTSGAGPSMLSASANGAAYDGRAYLYMIASNPVFGAAFTTGDVIGCAFDADTGKVWFSKNNTWQASGNPAAGTSPATTLTTGDTWTPIFGGYSTAGVWDANFGQRPFSYTPPAGFRSLCTANLPAVTITKPALHFNVKTQLGSAVNTGANLLAQFTDFVADFAWGKDRAAVNNHQMVDTVRGNTAVLQSNTAAVETTYTAPTSGDTCVAWGWKAGGAAVTNTAGSISSQVSANTTAGFAIVTWTGTGANATVGHGLGVAPKLVIVKNRITAATDWPVYHKSAQTIDGYTALFLDLTNARADAVGYWNNTPPTSTVFSVGTAAIVNGNTNSLIAYCFAEIPGYSKFGSYTGNASTDGPFVYCGFRPKWLLVKRTDVGASWVLVDAERDTYNLTTKGIYPNLANAEATGEDFDFTANGFKLRDSGLGTNGSGGTFIFAAFAEHPTGGANVSPAPAR